jgi:hypothetical protein
MNFLSVKGVNPKYNTSGAQKPTYEVCDIAKKFTVQVYRKGISPKTATGSAGPLVFHRLTLRISAPNFDAEATPGQGSTRP